MRRRTRLLAISVVTLAKVAGKSTARAAHFLPNWPQIS